MNTIEAPLRGKVAVVTGGSRGIGAGIALKFAEQGCSHIAITYNTNSKKAEDVLASIKELNPRIKTCSIAADLLDPDFGPKVIKQTLSKLGVDHIDILVSNAAHVDASGYLPIADMTKENWDTFMTADAWTSVSLSQEVIKYMPRGGRIIMISSGSSKAATGDPTIAYAAAKAAMDAVSRNLAVAWGIKYGVTVNSISVGPTDTDAISAGIEAWGEGFKTMISEFPILKRIGEVEEVANIVAFVASPQASWICGNQIPANGGGLSMLQS